MAKQKKMHKVDVQIIADFSRLLRNFGKDKIENSDLTGWLKEILAQYFLALPWDNREEMDNVVYGEEGIVQEEKIARKFGWNRKKFRAAKRRVIIRLKRYFYPANAEWKVSKGEIIPLSDLSPTKIFLPGA